jgi:hypothetical protein
VTPTGFFAVVFFVVVVLEPVEVVPEDLFVLELVVEVFVAALDPEDFDVVVLDADFDAFDAFDFVVVVAGVVAAGVVVVAARCAAVSGESSLPQPANARASSTPVVAVSFRVTRRLSHLRRAPWDELDLL